MVRLLKIAVFSASMVMMAAWLVSSPAASASVRTQATTTASHQVSSVATNPGMGSNAVPDTRDPGTPPPCGPSLDGAVWRNPVSGIYYRCRYVQGAGWQWVPIISCGPVSAASSPAYARQLSASSQGRAVASC